MPVLVLLGLRGSLCSRCGLLRLVLVLSACHGGRIGLAGGVRSCDEAQGQREGE